MNSEFSESTSNDVAEGDVVAIVKYKGKTYSKAFIFKDNNLGNKMKSAVEATARVLLGDYNDFDNS